MNSDKIRTNVIAPFVKTYSNGSPICYIFFGFLIQIFLVKIPRSDLSKPGVLYGNNRIFMAPHHEILEITEILNIFVTALDKEDSGKTKIKTIT